MYSTRGIMTSRENRTTSVCVVFQLLVCEVGLTARSCLHMRRHILPAFRSRNPTPPLSIVTRNDKQQWKEHHSMLAVT